MFFSRPRWPASILAPSAGDRCIAHSTRLKLDLWHMPANDERPAVIQADFELHGSIDLAGDVAPEGLALVRDLLKTFRTAPRSQEGGSEVDHE